MCFEKFSPFWRMALGALLGIILGIAAGLVFSLIITYISFQFSSPSDTYEMKMGPQYKMATFTGMGFGVIIGAILGAIYSNKK